MMKKPLKKGFTLVELSVAIGLITIMLITIALITQDVLKIYHKGITIKSINQIGRTLIDEFSSSISQSSPVYSEQFCKKYLATNSVEACEKDGSSSAIYQQYYTTEVEIEKNGPADRIKAVPIGGVFCSGKYTYIWNTGYVLGFAYTKANGADINNERLRVTYRLGGANTTIDSFRLLKVEDANRSICSSLIPSTYTASTSLTSPPKIDVGRGKVNGINIGSVSSKPTELLRETDSGAVLYDLVVNNPAIAKSSNHALYSASFILGTLSSGINIMTESNYCQTPSNYKLDFNYCAVNRFNFSAMANGA